MRARRFTVDLADPRAPSAELWASLSEAERLEILESLPSEVPVAMPEGDAHRVRKTHALEQLNEFYQRLRRRVYLSAELPVYYPGESMFAPDLLAVLDVELRQRQSWVTSHEGKGLDFVLEISVTSKRKDFEDNVVRYARLGIPEYFAFDVPSTRLAGWRLNERTRSYDPILPQGGRWPSRVLDLDLALEEGRLRFFHGSAPLLDAHELVTKLTAMLDEALRRAEEESRRAEEETRRAEEEARRAEGETRRADKLAARLRELGIDPDSIE